MRMTDCYVAMRPMRRNATLPDDFPFGFDDCEEGSSLKVIRCEPAETLRNTAVGTPIDQPRFQYPAIWTPLLLSSSTSVRSSRQLVRIGNVRERVRTDEDISERVELTPQPIDDNLSSPAHQQVEADDRSRFLSDEILLVS